MTSLCWAQTAHDNAKATKAATEQQAQHRLPHASESDRTLGRPRSSTISDPPPLPTRTTAATGGDIRPSPAVSTTDHPPPSQQGGVPPGGSGRLPRRKGFVLCSSWFVEGETEKTKEICEDNVTPAYRRNVHEVEKGLLVLSYPHKTDVYILPSSSQREYFLSNYNNDEAIGPTFSLRLRIIKDDEGKTIAELQTPDFCPPSLCKNGNPNYAQHLAVVALQIDDLPKINGAKKACFLYCFKPKPV
ncbi:hypothetical protein B0J14DRAFT_563485 [Halenospora varia]|nr:hypothetical protein B0J14DRAFT_563485 [Halenospora varia]